MKYPIGIQDFEQLRTEGYVYVDKTDLVYEMINTGKVYFLSRPRRFGKSMLISTLKAYFEGKKHLFEGLAIAEKETQWNDYPVIHLDFSLIKFTELKDVTETLNNIFIQLEKKYCNEISNSNFSVRFDNIIRNAHEKTGKQVAVLMDEYDAPLLNSMGSKDYEQIKALLRTIFAPLKLNGKYIKFLLLTGITKYSQLSIFSELNHLENISMLSNFSSICGISQNELLTNFEQGISELAQANNQTYNEAVDNLKLMYDGYHFAENLLDIYNPYSLIKALKSKKYDSYWFESGTPTFLLNLMLNQNVNIDKFESIELNQEDFNAPIIDNVNLIPTLYHSGYLTIKAYDSDFNTYTIGFPNKEVREGLIKSLVPRILPNLTNDENLSIIEFAKDLHRGDIEQFLVRMQAFFADIPYQLENKTEKHFQTMFYIFAKLIGQYAEVEKPKAIGRIDMVIKAKKFLYVFELKFDKTAKEALDQINSKDYAISYEVADNKLFKIGINFSTEKRTIDEWIIGVETGRASSN